MGPNPEPDHGITFKNPDCAPSTINPHRINWQAAVNFLEAKRRVMRILCPNVPANRRAALIFAK